MQKIVLKLDIHNDKAWQKAMKTVSGLPGIDSIAIEMKDKKMTVIGDIDPVPMVSKLRKTWHTEILTVGPAKEPKKKEEPKKDDQQKQIDELMKKIHGPCYPFWIPYHVATVEENPNWCVI
ncbi:hypothetical protein NMG60_11030476, partial [Bertholletia excelsa]